MDNASALDVMIERTELLPVISTGELVALAVALGARCIRGWSESEESLATGLPAPSPMLVRLANAAIQQGRDPLGDIFCRLTSPEQRRPAGATYTPHTIVRAMTAWATTHVSPDRIIDPGTGSARFLVTAGRRFPRATLVGIETDPLSAILARAHLATAGLASRSQVMVGDYRNAVLPSIEGRTLFIGNPPYVRHHLLGQEWKTWLVNTARRYGLEASQLAGLHVHFFLATAEFAKPGDVGILITAAEWLDVNYGRLVRELLLEVLGANNIQVIEPSAMPFPGTATTAVITGFEVGARPREIGFRRVAVLEDLGALEVDRKVRRERLQAADRWTPLTRASVEKREGFIELGELCRVHRGQVTGNNRVWIAGDHSADLPESVLFSSVTKARELFAAKDVLTDGSSLKRVIDLPVDLDQFDAADRRRIEGFLRIAQSLGGDRGFIASHRKAWWSVGLREPAPILATYMARRPPRFVRNIADARHLNIAHGLYPREPLSEETLRALAKFLSQTTMITEGRTYAGGLTKFEPREMERLMIPRPELLASSEFIEMSA
jgi:hypothetical protein